MDTFPRDISFYYPWRSYQKRVLDELPEHLQNDRLHLVAPPGSGKTVLGLEVMLRLNKTTLIVAPTLAIKKQWVDRFVELFLQTDLTPDWISTDLRKPNFVTVTTYQSLHQIYNQDNLESNDQKRLEEFSFQTLILDEAHHLRTSWWKSTLDFSKKMKEPVIVSLTATPPYDSSYQEWQRYTELCGPIDAEIYVPELVREGELCAHQDYIYFSAPTTIEHKPIHDFHKSTSAFYHQLIQNNIFKQLIESHPYIENTEEHLEDILAKPEYFFSMILYLKKVNSLLWKKAFKKVAKNKKDLPDLDFEWLEELLTEVLYQDEYFENKSEIKPIKAELARMGAVERRIVTLKTNKKIKKTLTRSVSKLSSIESIVNFEVKNLKESARMVILTDFIYKEELPTTKTDDQPLMRLGVIPIFEQLRRSHDESLKLAVVTGSIVIIPNSAITTLEKTATETNFTYSLKTLPHDENYSFLTWKTTANAGMVSVLTGVFEAGEINCLVGTAALLGEGWDAPAINSLILASYVGSYMLSNQMRGRAIRTEIGNEDKTANIWHLVCMDQDDWSGGHDYSSLARRFDSLMGLHMTEPIITTGINRMSISLPLQKKAEINTQNKQTLKQANERLKLYDRWQEAIGKADTKKQVFNTDKQTLPRPFILRSTIKSLIITVALAIGHAPFQGRTYNSYDNISLRIILGITVGLIISSPLIYKVIKGMMRNLSLEKNINQVGQAVYKTLYTIELIKTPYYKEALQTQENSYGDISIWLADGTMKEQKIFTQAMQDLLSPIENARYLLYRRSGRFFKKEDYHGIPDVIGKKREYVEVFLKQWKKHVDQAEFIYTRTKEGRQSLLNARTRALSALFIKKSEQVSEWRSNNK